MLMKDYVVFYNIIICIEWHAWPIEANSKLPLARRLVLAADMAPRTCGSSCDLLSEFTII